MKLLALLALVGMAGCAPRLNYTSERGRMCLFKCSAMVSQCKAQCYGMNTTAMMWCADSCNATFPDCGRGCPDVVVAGRAR